MSQDRTKNKDKRRENILQRAALIQKMVAQNYEPGNQSKSKVQAFRRYVRACYPMGERTFWRYMSIDTTPQDKKRPENGQMDLPFE